MMPDMKCDAGFGDAQWVVEITRVKTKEVVTFRLCTTHATNLQRADRSAETAPIASGRDCGTAVDEPEEDEED